jgi:hypothetical protein
VPELRTGVAQQVALQTSAAVNRAGTQFGGRCSEIAASDGSGDRIRRTQSECSRWHSAIASSIGPKVLSVTVGLSAPRSELLHLCAAEAGLTVSAYLRSSAFE